RSPPPAPLTTVICRVYPGPGCADSVRGVSRSRVWRATGAGGSRLAPDDRSGGEQTHAGGDRLGPKRSTPTRGGGRCRATLTTAHPHVRGASSTAPARVSAVVGPSPRAWGFPETTRPTPR